MFTDFFVQIFTENVRKSAKIPIVSRIFSPSKYGNKILEGELKRMFPNTPLFGWARNGNITQTKVAVMSTSMTGQSVAISNYNRFCPDADGS
jgi:hypothetical protein